MVVKEKNGCVLKDLGLVDYHQAYKIQKQCVEELLSGGPQTLIFCEHLPVLTLGRLSNETNILISKQQLTQKGIDVHYVDRGGDVTLHAPGQLVLYPIFDLGHMGKDLRRYLYQLEQVTIDLLGDFDIVANRFSGKTGVWVRDEKIASIGIGVRRWISFHGLAINVTTNLDLFSVIRPCGLDVHMTSMSKIKGEVNMTQVKKSMVKRLSEQFHLDINND